MTQTSPAWSAGDLARNPHTAADKADRVRRMFAAIANAYDLNNRIHSLGRDQSWRRAAVRMCKVQPGDEVLDVACGTGDLTEAFAAAKPRSVTGVDFTDEMLELARHKSARRRSKPNPSSGGGLHDLVAPTYLQADAMNLPFPDESFDIVSIAFGIRNVADPARALREFNRILRRGAPAGGGRLVVLEFSQPRNRVIRWLNDLYCGRIMPWTATLIARDRSGAYRYLPQSVASFMDSNTFVALLQSCGFDSIEVHRLTFGICTAYVARLSM